MHNYHAIIEFEYAERLRERHVAAREFHFGSPSGTLVIVAALAGKLAAMSTTIERWARGNGRERESAAPGLRKLV